MTALRGRRRERLAPAALLTGAVVASVAAGAVATSDFALPVAGVSAALAAVAVLARRFGLGVLIGILVLGAIDALPGPSLAYAQLPLGSNATDALIAFLLATLIVDNAQLGFRNLRQSPIGRASVAWSVLLAVYWLITVVRTSLVHDASMFTGGAFGRDFLYFALLVPLFVGTLHRESVRVPLLYTLAIGSLMVSIGHVAVTLGRDELLVVVHTTRTLISGDLVRVYALSNDLVGAALPLAVGAALLGNGARFRLIGAGLAAITGVEVALQLTRARYIGVLAGLALAVFIWLLMRDEAARLGRRQVAKFAVTGTLLLVAVFAYQPTTVARSAVNNVTQRFTSVFAEATSDAGVKNTVAYRVRLSRRMRQALGSSWPAGLGFVSPEVVYDPNLPRGSIRNSDVGVFNSLLTMGIIGTLLVYIPVLTAVIGLAWRRLARLSDEHDAWLEFGVFAWCVFALVSSGSLVVLFSASGLLITSLMLGLGASAMVRGSAHRPA